MILKTLQTSTKNHANEYKYITLEPFLLIWKTNNDFSYTKFPEKKINVEQILKLWEIVL
jgi:hypothetical protein